MHIPPLPNATYTRFLDFLHRKGVRRELERGFPNDTSLFETPPPGSSWEDADPETHEFGPCGWRWHLADSWLWREFTTLSSVDWLNPTHAGSHAVWPDGDGVDGARDHHGDGGHGAGDSVYSAMQALTLRGDTGEDRRDGVDGAVVSSADQRTGGATAACTGAAKPVFGLVSHHGGNEMHESDDGGGGHAPRGGVVTRGPGGGPVSDR